MSDSPQYDSIAESYRQVRGRLPVIEVFEHTLFGRLGEVSGKSALDLACGEGSNTRRLKESGTARTVGVDISAEMVRLAREQEQRDPLGIEYQVGAVQEIPVIDEFDMVTAIFLLNYAESRQDLVELCCGAYRNVKPGRRFLTLNENISRCSADGSAFRKYGFVFPDPRPSRDADPMTFELQTSAENWVRIESRYFHRETYEWALRQAGFHDVIWHDLVVPDELIAQDGPEYWSTLLTQRPMVLIECIRES